MGCGQQCIDRRLGLSLVKSYRIQCVDPPVRGVRADWIVSIPPVEVRLALVEPTTVAVTTVRGHRGLRRQSIAGRRALSRVFAVGEERVYRACPLEEPTAEPSFLAMGGRHAAQFRCSFV
jgi:hypothetical protein